MLPAAKLTSNNIIYAVLGIKEKLICVVMFLQDEGTEIESVGDEMQKIVELASQIRERNT